MATVEVYELQGLRGPVRIFPALAKHVLTIGSTTATSAAFGSGASFMTAISTGYWRAGIGLSPTSTGVHILVPPDTYFDAEIIPGHKIIALSSTTT